MKFIPSLCLVILASLCHHQISFVSADLISQTCGQTRFKDLCEKTLRGDPGSKSADIHGLAKIALKATSTNAKVVQSQISKLQKSTTDKYTLQALKDCAENYEGASEQLSDSLTVIESKHYADVNTWVTAAMSDSDSCEDGFKPGTSKLTALNNNFFQLCSNVLAIVNQAASVNKA
ncbi:Putative invertase inhibitor [Morus notabilis]|uniref:Putative invertase inhibitor n=1 Tax=Morus notabilis TaxID=981085 RepID=W9RIV8_9ROSA|nr:putative invertase inhibitor [Morus notabilis]EXB56094.1 Putative invertase inhibitor [Morus notabilis]